VDIQENLEPFLWLRTRKCFGTMNIFVLVLI